MGARPSPKPLPPGAPVVVDSDVLVWVARGNDRARAALEKIPRPSRRLSALVEMELVRGCRNTGEMRQLRRFLDGAFGETVQVTEEISRRALSLVGRHALRSGLEPVDALIAATALTVRAGLLTGNVKHFRPVSGLSLIPFRAT